MKNCQGILRQCANGGRDRDEKGQRYWRRCGLRRAVWGLVGALVLPVDAVQAIESLPLLVEGAVIKMIAVEEAPERNEATGNDTLRVGVDVLLKKGWKTYWRMPGDSGIAPVFDFSASKNISAAHVHWPVPRRFGSGGGHAIGYTDAVVFPVDIERIDRNAPTRLRMTAQLGICADICVPVDGRISLDVPVVLPFDPVNAHRLEMFRARVPVQTSDRLALSWSIVKTPAPVLRVEATTPVSNVVPDLFIEWPSPHYLPLPVLHERHGKRAVFAVPLDRLYRSWRENPGQFDPTQSIRLTLATDGGGLEVAATLGAFLVELAAFDR